MLADVHQICLECRYSPPIRVSCYPSLSINESSTSTCQRKFYQHASDKTPPTPEMRSILKHDVSHSLRTPINPSSSQSTNPTDTQGGEAIYQQSKAPQDADSVHQHDVVAVEFDCSNWHLINGVFLLEHKEAAAMRRAAAGTTCEGGCQVQA